MSGQLTAVLLTQTDTTPLFAVGTNHIDVVGRKYQYCKGGGTVAQYNYVHISQDSAFTVTQLTTTTAVTTANPAPYGCFQGGTSLGSTTYGWIFRGYGAHTGLFAISCAQDVKIYTTGTVGVVDDATSSVNLIQGLKLVTTITAAAASPAWACTELHCIG